MNHIEQAERTISRYGPKLPLHQLVERLNVLYHHFEAEYYEFLHPEITRQLPPIWSEMIATARRLRGQQSWRVLDFGCGTGFATIQILKGLRGAPIELLTCYDPSAEMLERCRIGIPRLFSHARFTNRLEMTSFDERYNTLVTNSVLHHMPNPMDAIEVLEEWLPPGTIWLCGHEPSSRYYRNADCQQAYKRFLQRRMAKRLVSPAAYRQALSGLTGLGRGPASRTAREAVRLGLMKRKPPPGVIERLVDFHSPRSTADAESGRGFDIQDLEQVFMGRWRLEWYKSYSFLGPFYEGGQTKSWRRRATELAEKYPEDGANFCAVWVKQ